MSTHASQQKSSAVQKKNTPEAAGASSSSGIRSSLSGMSYGEQVSALSPRVQAKNPPAPAANTGWTTVVRRNFAAWDKDGDGWIEHHEVRSLMKDPSLKGEDAAALAALHKSIEGLEELSNDETGDENDGITLADLTAYERGNAAGKNHKDAAGADYRHGTGKSQIASANRVKKAHGKAAAGATKNELFPNGAPSLSALKQGGLGDCYFLAAIGSVIARDPAEVVGMIRRNIKKGAVVSYTVTFPQKSLGSVTIAAPSDAEIARYSSAGSDGLWLIVMEKAYAEAKEGKDADIKEEIGEGNSLATGVDAMAGTGTDADDLWCTGLDTTKKKLTAAFGKKRKIVTASIMSKNDLHLPSGHAYSVIGWDGTTLTLRNPWGSNPAKVPATKPGFKLLAGGKFTMTLAKFDEIFSQICYQE